MVTEARLRALEAVAEAARAMSSPPMYLASTLKDLDALAASPVPSPSDPVVGTAAILDGLARLDAALVRIGADSLDRETVARALHITEGFRTHRDWESNNKALRRLWLERADRFLEAVARLRAERGSAADTLPPSAERLLRVPSMWSEGQLRAALTEAFAEVRDQERTRAAARETLLLHHAMCGECACSVEDGHADPDAASASPEVVDAAFGDGTRTEVLSGHDAEQRRLGAEQVLDVKRMTDALMSAERQVARPTEDADHGWWRRYAKGRMEKVRAALLATKAQGPMSRRCWNCSHHLDDHGWTRCRVTGCRCSRFFYTRLRAALLATEPGTGGTGEPPDSQYAINAALEQEPDVCSNCGEPFETWACGPGHAVARNERGLEWDGVTPF